MFSRIRSRVTFANVMMTLALMFAMSGAAYATKKYLIISTKQISPKVISALKGKTGAPGPVGPQGPAGPAGARGENGTPGNEGPQGKEGKTGPEGPKGETGSPGPKGETGSPGTDGQPWTPNNTLPLGASEAGTWGAAGMPAPGVFYTFEGLFAPISFTIPLAAPLQNATECGEPGHPACVVHIIQSGEATPAGCAGNIEKPGAEKGNLCIFAEPYAGKNVLAIFPIDPSSGGGFFVAGRAGTSVVIIAETAGKGVLERGTWAVTAE